MRWLCCGALSVTLCLAPGVPRVNDQTAASGAPDELQTQASIPEIAFDASLDFLKLPPDLYLGEVAGVAANSRGQLFVYTRTGNPTVGLGNSRLFSHGGSRLLEFDRSGAFVREIGQGLYAFQFAHAVRVDAQDNIWIVDEGSGQVVKFDSDGRVLMVLGRKPEAISIRLPSGNPTSTPPGRGATGAPGAGGAGDQFIRPSDVAFDTEGDIFVADGHGANARIAKFDRNGRFLLSWGSRGTDAGQFNTPHSLATDAQGNVYVADQGNKRIQIFDGKGAFKSQITNVGVPLAVCISSGPHQYLYSSHAGDEYGMDDAAIYKVELDGRIVGKFGTAGKQLKQFGLVNAIDCRADNNLYVGELTNWRVQKLTLHADQAR
jgi:DNA-binding beta-propeller fold protein YncE